MSKEIFRSVVAAEEFQQIATRFKMLGEPMRLRILQAVCKEPRTVNDIVNATGSTQANVSKHLALLAAAGILTRKKAGQRVYYGMKDQLAVKLCELVRAQLAE
ncbi:MAG TPA: metalloregulator ArsR/SmtB family transcription factor [Candidatus Limnocylindrales bacterium]|nr:metalloregulator ArsR/SmtB family transcription factor [Candidatus Limnocylindrales bacterium]